MVPPERSARRPIDPAALAQVLRRLQRAPTAPWLPVYVLEAWWAIPLCAAGMVTPRVYVTWRQQAHAQCRLRCDWLDRVH